MEVKLSNKNHISLSKSLSNRTKTSFPSHTLHLRPWAAAEIQRFKGLVKVFVFLFPPQLNSNKSKELFGYFVVGRNGGCRTRPRTIPALIWGETLSSISKMYGVSVLSIAAANKNIIDIDPVFKGQLLNIPAPSMIATQLDRVKKSRLSHSIRAIKAPSGQKIFTVLTSHGLSNAKSTGSFLVLVPLIAFCIGCVIITFRTRVARGKRHQVVDKSQAHLPGAKGMRWKSALDDSVEGDVFDSKLDLDSNSTSEDEAYNQYVEDYSRLEHEYQKFLSECGFSNCGYWRGGSPGA